MKIVILSDTHGFARDIAVPDGDILIHCGDLSMNGDEAAVRAEALWLASFPHPHKVMIAGNHDFWLQEAAIEPGFVEGIHYLCDSALKLGGLRLYGTPWIPNLVGWAFYASMDDQVRHFAKIPEGLDILITHGPPLGIFDALASGEHVGSSVLQMMTMKRRPKVHVFGHIHEAYGEGPPSPSPTYFVNASTCDEAYRPVNEPVVIEL